jgi:hypothetical protein
MVWGWDPYMTMLMRVVQGYTWVYGFGQGTIPVGPGLSGADFNPPLPTYNASLYPPGSIKVSLTLSDYPPYQAPVAVAPTTTITSPVGFLEMPFGQPNGVGDYYSVATGDTSPLNTTIVITNPTIMVPAGTYVKEAKGSAAVIGGQISVFWVKTA